MIYVVDKYIDLKNWFMNLYNNNGFVDMSAWDFEIYNEVSPDTYDDFDEFMKKEAKYDLKECKLIVSDFKKEAFYGG